MIFVFKKVQNQCSQVSLIPVKKKKKNHQQSTLRRLTFNEYNFLLGTFGTCKMYSQLTE